MMDTQEQNLLHTMHCPTTARQVVANDMKPYSIPGGQAIWWHCPACQGWHIQMTDDEDSDEEIFGTPYCYKEKPVYLVTGGQ
jgi:hypothetical protein